ncbi:SDR family NAD(P)-dependent oxidoreductase [Kribbella catacumbae]|uniref:SDR family NAD(P)-dependent oxidoreductase n=1 Tax=Kribbella catacumbae TaxID=460086 RepID=UPI00039B03C1|nr:SDR family oxidoreductase [Kribbella catacumbae]
MARIVVVSGGGTGIGFAAAERFAADGDQVVLLGRREEVLAQAAEKIPGATYCAGDLGDPKGAQRAADFIIDEYGTVDVVVHSAGGNGVLEPQVEHAELLETIAHDWTLNFRLNTLTAVLLTEALKDHLAAPGGRVLFLSSISAYRGSGRVAYGASKAALHPYAFALARELGPRGITVNAVAPGLIEDTPFFGEPSSEQRRRDRAAETATGRVGIPSDVVNTLQWLASEASGHITAQVIQVNGGAESSR